MALLETIYVEAYRFETAHATDPRFRPGATPHPDPPPQGGRGRPAYTCIRDLARRGRQLGAYSTVTSVFTELAMKQMSWAS